MVGSYYKDGLTGNVIKIKSAQRILDFENKVARVIKWALPIPLTDQWWKDLGFVFEVGDGMNSDHWKLRVNSKLKLQIVVNSKGFCLAHSGYNYRVIEYVHEIQLIAFVLTGKQLIKI